jgi:hypothetical protein
MTAERARAYGRVARTLADVGPSKLLEHEQRLVRDAADTLVLSPQPGDPAALAAIEAARGLADHLVQAGRWREEVAERLVADLVACGGSTLPVGA